MHSCRFEAKRKVYKRDTYFNDSKDPSYYDRRLQNEISEEYDQERDPRTDEYPEGHPDNDANSLQLPDRADGKVSSNASRSKADLGNDSKLPGSKGKESDQKVSDELAEQDGNEQDDLEINRRTFFKTANGTSRQEDPQSMGNLTHPVWSDERPDFILWGPALEETLLYECFVLESVVPLECWHEIREQAVPKLIKKEFLYLKIPKRIKPLQLELVFLEGYHINFYEMYATRVVIEPAQERMVFGYFDSSHFDARVIKANALRSKKEQERNMMRELKTDNLKNIQILIDKNGREYPIDNEDIYGDDEDSDRETLVMRKKGKGEIAQRMKQRKASGKVRFAYEEPIYKG